MKNNSTNDNSSIEYMISPIDYFKYYKEAVDKAANFLKSRINGDERFGVVLGSGFVRFI